MVLFYGTFSLGSNLSIELLDHVIGVVVWVEGAVENKVNLKTLQLGFENLKI